ncbi:homoserine dehydrogenase-domain-containing protein [Piptocephalis cylindrospora]|uniref:Homoserine dehydrogenase n=1 Tax=Piptocephalis cylindrospora TaxID=1907219 RepID=A0A4P9Y1K7_9FUNG|nr:homoserine dehydrogenase-domain-containing protein [Piptocephalis cylindrospora]|eukprot:RKP12554.1 homoserine dehydrogenase-domain-containing protein [Piptocephalis cylindrospora]
MPSSTINVGIIGVGLVGKCLLRNLSLDRHTKAFAVVGIANSKRALLQDPSKPISLGEGEEPSGLLSSAPALDPKAFITHLAQLQGPAVLVDCTSSPDLANLYPVALRQGVDVVTPNKKGFSSDLSLWNEVQKAAKESNTLVYHESTVGAGLPVLATLRDLVRTGDEILKVEGVFSGTLSYLFNTFCSPTTTTPPFSQALLKAKELGYTEPDPRDDLDGMDVARKVVIVARSLGLPLSLGDLTVENVVPDVKELREASSPEAFLSALPGHDGHFSKLREAAKAEGKVLRYVGSIDPRSSKGTVSLNAYPSSHPFGALEGSDNMVAFTTRRFPNPLVIQGSGAGDEVTVFGVLADLYRVHDQRCTRSA